jgi:spore coat polysaccharide biosynthesis predicted glycosyltransferase SpsG
MTPRPANVLFRVAAGPRVGFGHLVRCGVLADELGVAHLLSLRGSETTARQARSLGWALTGSTVRTLAAHRLDLIVVDDPSAAHARPWVEQARRIAIPVATLHDLGLALVDSDLSIDGSLASGAAASLRGPRYAVLDPELLALRDCAPRRRRGRVVIALGGGAHVRRIGVEIASRLRREAGVEVDLAPGFGPVPARALPDGCRWLASPGALPTALATATAAVVAGGMTLYESCLLATPAVGVAVVPAQRRTIRAAAAAGAVIDASAATAAQTTRKAVDAVTALVRDRARADRLGRRAGRLVDGAGAERVAAQLTRLMQSAGRERRNAA